MYSCSGLEGPLTRLCVLWAADQGAEPRCACGCAGEADRFEPVSEHPVAVLREDGFGVELNAPRERGLVSEPHDDAVVGARRDLKLVGHGFILHRERVVARGRKRVRYPFEHRVPGVFHERGAAVHELVSVAHHATKRFGLRLQTEANPIERDVLLDADTDQIHADTGAGWVAWPG